MANVYSLGVVSAFCRTLETGMNVGLLSQSRRSRECMVELMCIRECSQHRGISGRRLVLEIYIGLVLRPGKACARRSIACLECAFHVPIALFIQWSHI